MCLFFRVFSFPYFEILPLTALRSLRAAPPRDGGRGTGGRRDRGVTRGVRGVHPGSLCPGLPTSDPASFFRAVGRPRVKSEPGSLVPVVQVLEGPSQGCPGTGSASGRQCPRRAPKTTRVRREPRHPSSRRTAAGPRSSRSTEVSDARPSAAPVGRTSGRGGLPAAGSPRHRSPSVLSQVRDRSLSCGWVVGESLRVVETASGSGPLTGHSRGPVRTPKIRN